LDANGKGCIITPAVLFYVIIVKVWLSIVGFLGPFHLLFDS